MNTADLRRLDLSLLAVFRAVMRHRRTTAAAAELNVTQSAVSHSLARLRALFDDELFIRRPAGLEPTARALQLDEDAAALIAQAERLLGGQAAFDPADSDRLFRVSAWDYETQLFAPPLVARLRGAAPHAGLSLRAANRRDAPGLVQRGLIDVALGYFPVTDSDLRKAALLEERHVTVARLGHPLFRRETLTLEDYLAADHILVSFSGDLRGVVDEALAVQGAARRVTAAVPLFATALAVVAATDQIVTLPARIVLSSPLLDRLSVADPPVDIRRFSIFALWHRRSDGDPAVSWLVGEIEAIAAGLATVGTQ